MPNAVTTAKRLTDMTRGKRRIYVQTHNAIWKKNGRYKTVQMHRYWYAGRGKNSENILTNVIYREWDPRKYSKMVLWNNFILFEQHQK